MKIPTITMPTLAGITTMAQQARQTGQAACGSTYQAGQSVVSRVKTAVANCFNGLTSFVSRSTTSLCGIVARLPQGAFDLAQRLGAFKKASVAAPVIAPVAAPVAAPLAVREMSPREKAIESLNPRQRAAFDGLKARPRGASLETLQNNYLTKLGKAI